MVCVLGLLFGFYTYSAVKKLPVHKAMADVSALIYETCKAYLIQQGKLLLLLECFIGVVIGSMQRSSATVRTRSSGGKLCSWSTVPRQRCLGLRPSFWTIRFQSRDAAARWVASIVMDIERAYSAIVAKSGALGGEARVLDLKDHERAVVWVDGRIEAVLKPGLYALWTVFHDVRVETFDARGVRFDHADLASIVQVKGTAALLETVTVEAGHAGLFFKDGRYETMLADRVVKLL